MDGPTARAQAENTFFGREASGWVKSITNFHDIVHQQEYLSDRQKNQILIQRLQGDAKTVVTCHANDPSGYVLALKIIEYMFGKLSAIVQAVIAKVTRGRTVQ